MKLNNASSSEGQQNQPPMDDASFSQGQPMMDDGQGQMNMGPMAVNAGNENSLGMGLPIGGPGTEVSGGMGPMDSAGGQPSDDIMSIVNQLTDTDKEAVKAYAESMVARDETKQNNGNGQPMMEQVIFTKKQLKKMQENFGSIPDDELLNKKNRKELPKRQNKINDSPFLGPKFQ